MKPFIYLILLTSALSPIAQPVIDLFGSLKQGPYQVGFKNLQISGSQKDQQAKPIKISLWYPGTSKGRPLRFETYFGTDSENHDDLTKALSSSISGTPDSFSPDSLQAVLSAAMWAAMDVEAINERFPLILWSVRYGTVAYQSIISEYLASYGYVVAFAEDMPHAPSPWSYTSSEEKSAALTDQLKLMEITIAHLQKQPNVDPEKIGLMAWSYAGESAILTQINNKQVDVVIGLSGLGFGYGVYMGNTFAHSLETSRMQVPYLILTESISPSGRKREPPAFFSEMHPRSRFIVFEKLTHGNFNVVEGQIPGVMETHRVQSWSSGGANARWGYEATCRITLDYLKAQFEGADHFDEKLAAMQSELSDAYFTLLLPRGNPKH